MTENETPNGPEIPTRWENFKLYLALGLDTLIGFAGILGAGLGLTFAAFLAKHIGESRLSFLDSRPVEGIAFLLAVCLLALAYMWSSIFAVVYRRATRNSVLLTSIVGGLLMVGICASVYGSYKDRIAKHEAVVVIETPLQPSTMQAGKLAEDIARHPELTNSDARVIALAQAIKNIMAGGRIPCPEAGKPLTDGKPQPRPQN